MALRFFIDWIRPTLDALFGSNIPLNLRLRMIPFQVIHTLTYCLGYLPWSLSDRYTIQYLPTRSGRSVRAIVFRPLSRKRAAGSLAPLHIDIHGGGFLGGLPEYEAAFLSKLSNSTGAVVVSPTYRYAPRHAFPAAIDDIDDVVRYLIRHAPEKFGADPRLLTMSGFSSGANLALATSLQDVCRAPSETAVKAMVTFYAPVDLRRPPYQKNRPPGFPRYDPIWWMAPLFDSYARLAGPNHTNNPRLHPILAPVAHLPKNIMMIVPTMDILLSEQTQFYERVKNEMQLLDDAKERRIEFCPFEGQLHGWLELPRGVINEDTRTEAHRRAIEFIQQTHRDLAWTRAE